MQQLDLLSYQPPIPNLHFHGTTYNAALDCSRLSDQQRRVWDAVADGRWYTLREIANITGDPEASISARLRDFSNHEYLSQFFIMTSERTPGLERKGVWRYRVLSRGP